MSDNKIPFSYDKYLSGGYRVESSDGTEFTNIRETVTIHYVKADRGSSKNLTISPLDLFLIPISKEGDKEEKHKRILEIIDKLILNTQSGEARNLLTELNILIQSSK